MNKTLWQAAILSSSALVAIGACITPAQAQIAPVKGAPADASASEGTVEIVVSARRKDELLQDVPLTVNAVTAAQVQKLNLRDFKDIATIVPGLTLTPSADPTAPTSQLRGVNYNVNNSGNAGTIQFYLNESPVPAANLFQSLYDVGQVEVLRGPQGTLRGVASPSGSITVTTMKPKLDEFGGTFYATVNNIGGINGNGAVNIPIIRDILAVRLAGVVDDNEANRVRSINNPSFAPYSRSRGERASVLFEPTGTLQIAGTYQHYLNKTAFFDPVESASIADPTLAPSGTLITAGSRQAAENTPRNVRADYSLYNLTARWEVAGQKLDYVGGWTRLHARAQSPLDVGGVFSPRSAVLIAGAVPGSLFITDPNTDPATNPTLANFGQLTDVLVKSESHEFRVSNEARVFGFLDYVVGGLINRQTSFDNPLIAKVPLFGLPAAFVPAVCGIPAASQPVSPIGTYCFGGLNDIFDSRNLEKSVFGNLTAHIGDATEISGGLRYIHNNASSATSGSVPLPTLNDTAHATIYSATVKHRFNPHLMVYASTGSSFRVPPNTNPIIFGLSGAYSLASDPFLSALFQKPIHEKSKSYEIGAKTDWFDHTLQLDLTYYHQDFTNFIYSGSPVQYRDGLSPVPHNPGPTSSGVTVPVPAKVDGIEAEYAFRPSANFSVEGTLSYALAKITGGLIPCPPTASSPLTQTNLLNFCSGKGLRAGPSAPFSATVQAEYTRPVTSHVDAFVRGQLTFYGASQSDPLNAIDDIKAYAPVNLFLGVHDADNGWEITAYSKNIFNVQRVLSRDLLAAQVSSTFAIPSDYRAIRTTAPREFGIILHYAFGSR